MTKRNKILARTAIGLFCLVLVSVYLLSGMLARYISSAEGSDSARVATWEITQENFTSEALTASFAAATYPRTADHTVKVRNRSEVAANAIITLSGLGNLPITAELLDESSNVVEATIDQPSYTAVWVVPMAAESEERTFIIRLTFADHPDSRYAGMTDILTLSLIAEQID